MRNSSVSLVEASSVLHLQWSSALLDHPTMRDPLTEALERLIQREGGREKVADEIQSSEQTLYQIIKGVKDSRTGTPKGVGPSLRKRLDARYPGWRELVHVSPVTTGEVSPGYLTPVHAIQAFMDALDPVLLPSARAVLHQFIDGTVGADEAAVSLQKLFALSSPETNRRFADIRSSLDLPGPGGTTRATKFATR